MIVDMNYDGQRLTWPGHGGFQAVNGLPGQPSPDHGAPGAGIPPGKYRIVLAGESSPTGRNTGRVRMEPADVETQNRCSGARSEFYIDDAANGHRRGCIGVDSRLFPILSSYARTNRHKDLVIEVAYAPANSAGDNADDAA